ncbi:caspase family protein [Deinococcus misasensis]|uniref:caspase family protein n=1 Tax=Deinococcus misasensis TaxID=392413 RepID=UPI00055935CF|nr:caspase family protein [Deinococcus misasensis]
MNLKTLGILACLGLCSVAYAENRALLVGLAEYKDPKANLRGPETDISLMKEVIGQLGFKPEQTRTLLNQQATRANILAQMRSWLTEGVGPQDRVIFYYTGHGAQVKDRSGDESDGCDESIVPYDLNVILDDEIQSILQQIKAREVLVMFDSCFSGTVTKSLFGNEDDVEADSKFWDKASTGCGIASNKEYSLDDGALDSIKDTPSQNYIEFSAAAENQVALGALRNGEGSAFTQAVYNGLSTLPKPISFEKLRDYAVDWIKQRAKNRAHTPQLSGPQKWLNTDFYAFGRADDPAPVASAPPVQPITSSSDLFTQLVRKTQFKVEAEPSQPSYRLGEKISFKVRSSKAGYLNIIELDPQGNMVVVFPNKYNDKNQVRAGEVVTLPGQRYGNFDLQAIEPIGKSRVLALVTSEPLNLLNANIGSLAGIFKVMAPEDAPAMTTAVTRAIGIFGPAPTSAPTTTPTPDTTPQPTTAPATPQNYYGAAELTLETTR